MDERGKRCKVAAPQYIDYVMTYAQKTINDESIFPTKFGMLLRVACSCFYHHFCLIADKEFPSTFESIVKKIMKLLYHVIAHIYHSHFKEIVLLNLHPHLNCIFAHIVLFNERFKLIEEKELEVLHDLAVALKLYPPNLICDTTQEIDIASATFNTRPNGSDDNNNAMTSDYCPTGGSVITTPCRSMGGPFAEVTDKSLCDVSLAPVDDSLVDSSEMKENNNDNLHCYGLGHEDYCVNSPMLVDEPEMSSPEPMLVEPMSSSENLPKKCIIDTTNSLRGRSISANAVLSPSKSLEAFPISPITRRCNSDRTSAKSNSALFYQSTDSPRGPLFQTTSYDTRAGCGR